MPYSGNVTNPILVIGSGRSGSSWVIDILNQVHGVQVLIENDVVDTMLFSFFQGWWTTAWPWVCDSDEQEQRIVQAVRNTLCELFPATTPYWAMKMLWRGHPWDLVQKVFPNARYIHVTRAPTTAVPSMMEFMGRHNNIWQKVEHSEREYNLANKTALDLRSAGVPYLLIRQEDMRSEPEIVWDRIREFCELPDTPGLSLGVEINAAPSTRGNKSRNSMEWSRFSRETILMAEQLGYSPPPEYLPDVRSTELELQRKIDQLEHELAVQKHKYYVLQQKNHQDPIIQSIDQSTDAQKRDLEKPPAIDQVVEPENDRACEIIGVELLDLQGAKSRAFDPNSIIHLKVTVKARKDILRPNVGFMVSDNSSSQFGSSSYDEYIQLPSLTAGEVLVVSFRFTQILRVGIYHINVYCGMVTADAPVRLSISHTINKALSFTARTSYARPIRYIFHNPLTIEFSR